MGVPPFKETPFHASHVGKKPVFFFLKRTESYLDIIDSQRVHIFWKFCPSSHSEAPVAFTRNAFRGWHLVQWIISLCGSLKELSSQRTDQDTPWGASPAPPPEIWVSSLREFPRDKTMLCTGWESGVWFPRGILEKVSPRFGHPELFFKSPWPWMVQQSCTGQNDLCRPWCRHVALGVMIFWFWINFKIIPKFGSTEFSAGSWKEWLLVKRLCQNTCGCTELG